MSEAIVRLNVIAEVLGRLQNTEYGVPQTDKTPFPAQPAYSLAKKRTGYGVWWSLRGFQRASPILVCQSKIRPVSLDSETPKGIFFIVSYRPLRPLFPYDGNSGLLPTHIIAGRRPWCHRTPDIHAAVAAWGLGESCTSLVRIG